MSTKDVMWSIMVNLFNAELEQRRRDVDGLATVLADGPNRVRVDSVAHLHVGMVVEIADPTTDTVVATNLPITSLDAGTGLVGYDGADVTAAAKQVLRRPRHRVHGFDQIDVDGVTIRRRVPAGASFFTEGYWERLRRPNVMRRSVTSHRRPSNCGGAKVEHASDLS